jgi:hypothetical protein
LLDLPRTVNVDGIGFDRSSGDLLYSIDADASYGGDAFLASDVIRWNGSNHSLEFDGRRLPPGTNLDAFDDTDEGTQVFSFASLGPSGNWDSANLDALYVETTASADQLFADGFESP